MSRRPKGQYWTLQWKMGEEDDFHKWSVSQRQLGLWLRNLREMKVRQKVGYTWFQKCNGYLDPNSDLSTPGEFSGCHQIRRPLTYLLGDIETV